MPNHKNAKKAVRQSEKRREQNHYYKKTTRTAIKRLRSLEKKEDALKFFPKVVSMIDRLAKKHQIHANKASNLKSKLALFINSLAS